MSIGDHLVTILQQKEGFDLRIDNVPFEKLNYMMSKEDSVKDNPIKPKEETYEEKKEKKGFSWNELTEKAQINNINEKDIPGIFANRKKKGQVPPTTESEWTPTSLNS